MTQLTWLVTECSSGFGGDRAIATARGHVERLASLKDAGAAVLSLDKAIAIYGGIDVVVNSAEYIEAGIAEEVTQERSIAQFNTNLFGSINITRALLPHFREKKSGVIVYLSSLGGIAGEVGGAAYCASKFALEGVSESMKLETEAFGIRSHLFQLGHCRTKILNNNNNFKAVPRAVNAYKDLNDMIYGFLGQADSNPLDDPEKAVNIMIDVVRQEGVAEGKTQPLRLPIGKNALATLKNKYINYFELCDE
ncbi:hydroxybutyrate dehydrogenase [Corynespora cassiicola Philippines]|uniref:Hydroxybutyrate dehydrogenase n=1 Tax=Corynespora cassiicola Philippines TaxID=1448308 RepID=A0A2T2P5R0_CORCC|nr:hydroxybutyrate dehydrogenase [Corynespora cassiicola Philippines]